MKQKLTALQLEALQNLHIHKGWSPRFNFWGSLNSGETLGLCEALVEKGLAHRVSVTPGTQRFLGHTITDEPVTKFVISRAGLAELGEEPK